MASNRSKPCDPRTGQAEYEACLEEKRASRRGEKPSRLTAAFDEYVSLHDEELDIDDED